MSIYSVNILRKGLDRKSVVVWSMKENYVRCWYRFSDSCLLSPPLLTPSPMIFWEIAVNLVNYLKPFVELREVELLFCKQYFTGFWKLFAQHSWYQVEVYATVLKEVRYSITCRAIQIKIVYLILPNEISSKKEITNYKLCVLCLKPLRYFLLLV
jgi:hypothetical protein